MNTAVIALQDFDGRVKGQVCHVYAGAPDQGQFGGPYGNAMLTKHVDIGSMAPSIQVLEADVDELTGDVVVVENSAAKAAYVAEQTDKLISAALARHEDACKRVFDAFKLENAKLGIKNDSMKNDVLQKLSGVLEAINSGDGDLVIERMKAVPSGDYDSKYITEARLLKYVNMLETLLGYPLTEDLTP